MVWAGNILFEWKITKQLLNELNSFNMKDSHLGSSKVFDVETDNHVKTTPRYVWILYIIHILVQ